MLFGKDLYAQVPLTEVAPPALPSLSPQVWQAAFVHSSKNIGQIPRSKFRYAEDFADNERLEWVGDALLYSIVANYLFRTYPKLRVSYLSAIRQRMVQNATLAKFAKLYKMDQALVMGAGAENMRNDQKTLADTFEAFVGAVHQVHGLEITTKWVEDLIRPYATQLYEHYARIYGEDASTADEPAPSEASSASPRSSKRRWRRFCGFLPIPFLYTPETKSITSSSSEHQGYGTLIPVSQVADNQGYTRLSGNEAGPSSQQAKASSTPASALKKGKNQETTFAQNTSALANSASAAVKRSKSRDRVAFTPPSVTNLESLKSAQKKAKQAAAGSLSEGELPRTVPGLTRPAPSTPQSTRKTNGFSAPQPDVKENAAQKQPEVVVYPVAGQNTPARPPAATFTSGTFGSKTVQPIKYDTPSGAPSWGSDNEGTNAKKQHGTSKANNATPSTQRTILSRPADLPVGQAPSGTSKTLSAAQSDDERSLTVSRYVEALTAAQSDPVAYLESHPTFNSAKNRKAKTLQYDDSASTPKKCIVQIKVDGKMIASSAAAGQDTKLAKARAAFKAIDALSLLPDAPEELGGPDGFSKQTASTVEPPQPGTKKEETSKAPILAVPGNSVWLPDLFRKVERQPLAATSAPQTATPAQTEAAKEIDSAKVDTATSAPVQVVASAASSARPFPESIYSSLPGPGVKGSGLRYYITSVKGFAGGTYHAILNAQLELIGQAVSSKKATAIEEAEQMAKANAASGKKLDRTLWQFADCSQTGELGKKVKLQQNPKSNTGEVPLLTDALAVNANEKSRVIWLEWYADDKKAWKCVVFADAVYFGSGKNADRKQALTIASANALNRLEEAQKTP
ncbi:hypothetical protein P389DRAFT_195961 [Cystobasidium minutum MCA 4210]|uniref:uncharacterized protein n=1 Tax=Cystobasidium minutum MCA 4210 TaxID=1397322 RepID=UPI0034CE6B4E|eukprot:jgi/Rhomi1/195961/gm1.4175_g